MGHAYYIKHPIIKCARAILIKITNRNNTCKRRILYDLDKRHLSVTMCVSHNHQQNCLS